MAASCAAITDVAGMEARRALKAGELIRTSDLKRPTMVAKGSTVTMLFEAPGMRLSAVGRALAEGAEGDTITDPQPDLVPQSGSRRDQARHRARRRARCRTAASSNPTKLAAERR